MSNYDFSTLNPIDFEKLVCDLLNVKNNKNAGVMFRSFKEGKDSGIDLLLSTKECDLEIVAQVKHYYKSSYATLKRDLRAEVTKVKKLNPKNYIFITSIGLSKHNKDEIKSIFSPYIFSLDDILGRDDLNDILRLHKFVEDRHFKLWFSSSIAIEKLLQYKFVGRNNEFGESEIKRRLRLFVSTKELRQSIRILNQNKFLVITGEPGVGKTTLSEILIYKYLSKEYHLTVIYDDVKEIELTLKDDNSKQIFYFDDFLGHTQAEILKSKSAETSLLKIITRIEKAENKLLILNTRKFILNTFLEESERFRNFNPLRSEEKIELHSYSYGAKRRMLDNHIAESELSLEHIGILKNLAFFICNHKNFSPRHLEFYTGVSHIGKLSCLDFKNFIIENLENPRKIWEHAYFNQISDLERFLLNTLYSLGSNASKENLEKAFNARLNYEVANNNYFKPIDPFNNSLRKLNDGFIVHFNNSFFSEFSFINPSLEDFLKYFIENNIYELERILFSSTHIDQWFVFCKPFTNNIIRENLSLFFANVFVREISDHSIHYKSAILLLSFKQNNLLQTCNILKSICNWNFIRNDQFISVYSLMFLKECIKSKILIYTISKLDLEYFLNLLLNCEILEEIYELIFLFKNHFDLNFKIKFHNDSEFYGKYKTLIKEVYALCENLLQNEIEEQYDFLYKNMNQDGHWDVLEQLDDHFKFVNDFMFEKLNIDYSYLFNPNWNEIAEQNYSNYLSIGKETGLEYSEEDEYSQYTDYAEDDYYDDYDYEREKLFAVEVIDPFEDFEPDDLPF